MNDEGLSREEQQIMDSLGDIEVLTIVRRVDEEGLEIYEIDPGDLPHDTVVSMLATALQVSSRPSGCTCWDDEDDEEDD